MVGQVVLAVGFLLAAIVAARILRPEARRR